MKLEFKFGKLAIRDVNKMLYHDYTSYASTPRNPKLEVRRKAPLKTRKTDEKTRSYNMYFKHNPKTLINSKVDLK